MWTKTRSLFLSRILTAVVTVMTLAATFFVPAVSSWYNSVSVGSGIFASQSVTVPMCVIMYLCEVLALAVLVSLHVLLSNIDRSEVFIPANARCLRVISWACMLAGAALAVLGLWRFVFLLPAILAVMVGLIMRVLKNVFEKAVEIKSENDYTI